jgi:integration host factor subunit beta
MTYTKRDIVRKIAEDENIPLSQVEPWVDRVIVALRDTMMKADPTCRIELRHFGVFEVKTTDAKHYARNPRTQEKLYIPERRKTHFKPSKYLRNFLQQPINEDKSRS